MVYLKVSDGSETRKLQVTPGEITFDQLKEQLATLFPKSLGDASSGLSLQYRDVDGDVITLSSDHELQEALSQLQKDSVWRLYIRSGQPTWRSAPSYSDRRRHGCNGTSLLHHLIEPDVKPFGLLSDVLDGLEELLQCFHGDANTNNGTESEKKSGSETTSKSEGEATATTTSTEYQERDEEVKSKPQATGAEGNKAGDNSTDGKSQWQTRSFVTWEPRLHVGPFGFFHSHLSPVVYNVAFRSSSPSSGKGDEEAKTETKEQADSSAATPAKDEQVPPATTTDAAQQ